MNGSLLDQRFTVFEANEIGLRRGPDIIYVRLSRNLANEPQVTTMLAELSVIEARKLMQDLQTCLASSYSKPEFELS